MAMVCQWYLSVVWGTLIVCQSVEWYIFYEDYLWGVVMAAFDLTFIVSEAQRTDRPFSTIPDAVWGHRTLKSMEHVE